MNAQTPITEASPSAEGLYLALANAQGELANPEKTKTADTGKYKYKYADIADVLNISRPILARHGLAVAQLTWIREGTIVLETRLMAASGGSISSEYPVCPVTPDQQKIGSALTYARRYALCAMLGIAAEEDVDGVGTADIKPAKKSAPVGRVPDVKIDPAKPQRFDPVSTEAPDVKAWCTPYSSAIKSAPSLEVLDKWAALNDGTLVLVEQVAPKLHQRLVEIQSARAEEFSQQEKTENAE